MEKNKIFGKEDTFQELYLKNIFRIIFSRIKLIIFFAGLTFFAVFIRTYTMTPVYRAYTEILLEEKKPLSLFTRQANYTPIDPTFLATQYEIIKSYGVLENVIDELQLDTKHLSHFIEQDDPDASAGIIQTVKDSIKSLKNQAKDQIKKLIGRAEEDIGTGGLSGDQSGGQSRRKRTDREKIIDILYSNLTIAPISNTKIVRFLYTDKSPAMAALIANTLVEAYKSELMEIKLSNANYSFKWMKLKADEEQKKLLALEEKIQKYARDNDIVTIENRLTILPDKLEEYNTRLTEAKSRQQELQEINEQLQASGGNVEFVESLPLVANNPVLRSISSQLLDLDRRIAELSKKYGPKHPRMTEARNERSTLANQKKREVNRILQSAEREYELAKEAEKNLSALFIQTKSETLLLNERLNDYDRMKRELETGRTLYDSLVKNMKEASARTQEKTVNVWVAKKAVPPLKPSKPKKKINLALALIFGMAGGLSLAFFLEYLDDTIKAPEDIEQYSVPVLGVVEKVPEKSNKDNLLIDEGSFSTLAESYKIIRSSVLLSSPDNPPRSILVTSPQPGDGKTTTTTNFARSLAMLQSCRVIVIDCDLRRPRLHKSLKINVEREKSLSYYLAGITTNLESIICNRLEVPFDFIPAGPQPPNPSELLSSEKMRSLLLELRGKYDHIIVDSPPIFGAIDGVNLSTIVDGTLLVVSAHKTTKGFYSKVLHRFESIDSRILGTVINRAEIKKSNLYHYAGYYASYGPEGKES